MGADFEGIKKLVPERRVIELKKLIQTLQKEIQEREQDVQAAELLLTEADEEARVIEQVQIPETIEAKAETPEEEKGLENLLATAPQEKLVHEAAHRPLEELYGTLKTIYDRQKTTGVETRQDRQMIYAIHKGIEVKKQEGYTPPSDKTHLMTAAEQMANAMYKNVTESYNS